MQADLVEMQVQRTRTRKMKRPSQPDSRCECGCHWTFHYDFERSGNWKGCCQRQCWKVCKEFRERDEKDMGDRCKVCGSKLKMLLYSQYCPKEDEHELMAVGTKKVVDMNEKNEDDDDINWSFDFDDIDFDLIKARDMTLNEVRRRLGLSPLSRVVGDRPFIFNK